MNSLNGIAKPLAYGIVAAGCVLSLAAALAPLPTGSFKLSVGFLLLGMTPYVVYGSFTEVLGDVPVVAAGILLIAFDLLARIGASVTAASQASVIPAIMLCLALVLLVLPAGAGLGKLLSK